MSISRTASSLEHSLADAESVDLKQPASRAIRPAKRRSLTPRTKSVFTRVTEAEYQQIQAQAGTLPVNTYARYVLLKESRLLEEILALRMIVLNLSDAQRERVVQVKDQADAEKSLAAKEIMET